MRVRVVAGPIELPSCEWSVVPTGSTADRFGLVTRTKTREMRIYTLTVAKPGAIGPA